MMQRFCIYKRHKQIYLQL